MGSTWTGEIPQFPTLRGGLRTDVLVIGGVTKNTTAKITSQHGLVYDKLLRRFGAERAGMYLEANQAALAEYRRLCAAMESPGAHLGLSLPRPPLYKGGACNRQSGHGGSPGL